MRELTPVMIVNWFRKQAQKFNEMADFVEGTFAGGMPRISSNGTVKVDLASPGKFTAENVREAVKERGHRRADLAALFGVPITRVDEMIADKSSGLYVAERAGWVKVKEEGL